MTSEEAAEANRPNGEPPGSLTLAVETTTATIASQGDGGESNSTCMVCMEEWTIGTEHRICCLKCGHLFGRSCIERWIKEKGSNAKCPTCNKPAKKVDLRDLWCKTIKAMDQTEVMILQQALDAERRQRKTDSATIFHQNLKLELLQEDNDKMKRTIADHKQTISKQRMIIDRFQKLVAQNLPGTGASGGNNGTTEADTSIAFMELSALNEDTEVINIDVDNVQMQELKGKFHFAEKVDASYKGGCRCFTLCPTSRILLVAQPAPQESRNVFGGFGLRKFSIQDTSCREFIPLHAKTIVSLQLKPVGDLILTASQDKKIRLTSITNNTCVQAFESQFEPSCVAWSAHRDQQFYVASGNCYVSLYDIRNTSEYIYQTSHRVAQTRLLSIAPTTSTIGDGLHGLLVNDSKGSQFLEVSETSNYDTEMIDREQEHLRSHQLPFAGLMGSVDFCKAHDLALISTRTSPQTRTSSHTLVKLRKTSVVEEGGENGNGFEGRVECRRFRSFTGGRSGELFSHSRIHKHPTLPDKVLVCAGDGDSHGIKLWDSSDCREYQTIRTDVFIRDTIMYCPENSNQHILYALSDKSIGIYRWDYV